MKIICEKEKLLKGINSVINGVASKTTMPILEGILIQTNDKEVKFIYDKSQKIFKWLFKFYSEAFNWKVRTSFRIAFVKVLSYVIIIIIQDINLKQRINFINLLRKLAKQITILSDDAVENMACDDTVVFA